MDKKEFIRKVYLYLKSEFSQFIGEKHWIWIDYFKDEQSGYTYFEDTYLSDIDKIAEQFDKSCTEEENIYNVASYIGGQLEGSEFFITPC